MCIYCDLEKSGEEKELAKTYLYTKIEMLEDLRDLYYQILRGELRPHTKEMKKVALLEKAILRDLAKNI